MKIAVSSNGENLDAQLDPRFGRCAYFLLVNPEDMSVEAFNNESAAQGGGAGIQAAQFLASKKVAAVITGNCGPNAVRTLSAAGIKLFGGQAGSVREVIEIFKKGNLKPIFEATVDSHFGMNTEAGSGRAAGMGGGRGMRGGSRGARGTARDMGRSDSRPSRKMGGKFQSRERELEALKHQADSLNKKMKAVISRTHNM